MSERATATHEFVPHPPEFHKESCWVCNLPRWESVHPEQQPETTEAPEPMVTIIKCEHRSIQLWPMDCPFDHPNGVQSIEYVPRAEMDAVVAEKDALLKHGDHVIGKYAEDLQLLGLKAAALESQLAAEGNNGRNWLAEGEQVAAMFPDFGWPLRMSFSEAVAAEIARLKGETK